MQRIVDGRVIDIPSGYDGSVSPGDVMSAAGIQDSNTRSIVLQTPEGNKLVPPSSRFYIPSNATVTHVPTHRRGLNALSTNPILIWHIRDLSYAYPLNVEDDFSEITVKDVPLPRGYNFEKIPIRMRIPSDYPISVPGLGYSKIYIPRAIKFNGFKLQDVHYNSPHPNDPYLAWMCYEEIQWDSRQDDLITLVEMIKADLQNPKIKWE